MREALAAYVNRVRDLAEHCKGNEQATKQSLIGPLFTLLGYDLTDPRQCVPEYRADFGKERSAKPIDWAFMQAGKPLFFVEAKEVGRKLVGFDEQLADYFAKAPEARLGILTNGLHWRFFTDLEHEHVMDKEPFVKWDVLGDEQPPIDFLTILQKSEYNATHLKTYAKRRQQRNLLVGEVARLLEPSTEFTKLVIANIETRNLVSAVVESWKPVVAGALNEWAKQRALSSVLESQTPAEAKPATQAATADEAATKPIETTQAEKSAFALIQRLLGNERPIAYEDSAAYFKIHVADRKTWVMCRLQLDRKRPIVWVPIASDKLGALPSGATVSTTGIWSCIALDSDADIGKLSALLQTAWDAVKANKGKGSE